MSHTPGPWNVERPYGEPGTYITCPSTALVAKVWGDEDTEANARLIASAPDLLAALRSVLELTSIAFCYMDCTHPAFTVIRGAHHAAKLAIAASTRPTLNPSQLRDARDWLAENLWAGAEVEDIVNLGDAEVANGIARHYCGGIEGFICACTAPETEVAQ